MALGRQRLTRGRRREDEQARAAKVDGDLPVATGARGLCPRRHADAAHRPQRPLHAGGIRAKVQAPPSEAMKSGALSSPRVRISANRVAIQPEPPSTALMPRGLPVTAWMWASMSSRSPLFRISPLLSTNRYRRGVGLPAPQPGQRRRR